MKAKIVTLPGDGIGPEVTAAAVEVLRVIAARYSHELNFEEHPIGGAAIDLYSDPLPPPTLIACRNADAVLLGAVGGPRWSDPKSKTRPEQGLLALRAGLGVYANLRPVSVHPRLAALSPLKNEKLAGVDILFVRELTGGAYFGAKTRTPTQATDETKYTVSEIERVARRAFALARSRRGHVTSVDKANVLETSRLWRETVTRIAGEFSDVSLEHQLVDSMAMLLLTRPSAYDVVVTENLFGDIVTDLAAIIRDGLGIAASGNTNPEGVSIFQPTMWGRRHPAQPAFARPIYSRRRAVEKTRLPPPARAYLAR